MGLSDRIENSEGILNEIFFFLLFFFFLDEMSSHVTVKWRTHADAVADSLAQNLQW